MCFILKVFLDRNKAPLPEKYAIFLRYFIFICKVVVCACLSINLLDTESQF